MPAAFAGLLALGFLSTAASAQTLTITVQEGAGPTQSFTDSGSLSGAGLSAGALTVTTADYSISFLGSNASENGGSSQVQSSTTSVTDTNFLGGGAAGLLTITITATGYTGPSGSTTVTSSIGGSVTTDSGGKDSLSFNSMVNGTNLATQSFTDLPKGSYNNTISPTVSSLPSTYSMGEVLQIQLNSFNDKLNYSSSTDLTNTPVAVPEPSTMAIAGLGGLGMLGYGLRRRKALGA